MNKNTFKSLSDLSKSIEEKTRLIQNGKYGLSEIENALQELAELQERLIVLKYKAIEEFANQSVQNADAESSQIVQNKQDRLEEEQANANQMTLMDGISQAMKEVKTPEIEFPEETQASPDENAPESIADKMKSKAIAEIKPTLSINQKFLFTKNLFNDNAEAFNSSLAKIENCKTFEEAQGLVEQFKKEYDWQEEEVSTEFMDIVQRRFA